MRVSSVLSAAAKHDSVLGFSWTDSDSETRNSGTDFILQIWCGFVDLKPCKGICYYSRPCGATATETFYACHVRYW